jgi:hypothetical protein
MSDDPQAFIVSMSKVRKWGSVRDVSDELFLEWKAAPQRGHHANQEITLPAHPDVCGPTRARRSQGQTEEREPIDQD